jgi:mono/diheme cytochrome c family protein
MSRTAFPIALAVGIVLNILTARAGGWAVITVADLPEQIVAGEPTTFGFAVRQHGTNLLTGLQGRVSARSGSRSVTGTVTPKDGGLYAAVLTLPEPGEWVIRIDSGFLNSAITLLPMKAVARATPHVPVALRQRGRQLFVAKGCQTCHVHRDVQSQLHVPVGSDLSDKRYPDGLLEKLLADPSMVPRSSTYGLFTMPDLQLQQAEIAALVAFINAPRTAAARVAAR